MVHPKKKKKPHGNYKHGNRVSDSSRTPTYVSWLAMKLRCLNPNHKDYHGYGGRGIAISDRWLGVEGYNNFYSDLGPRPEEYCLEREDVNGDYCPENCVWLHRSLQARNRRNTRRVTFRGVTQALVAWAEQRDIKPNTLKWRLDNGWSVKDALGYKAWSSLERVD